MQLYPPRGEAERQRAIEFARTTEGVKNVEANFQ